MSEWNILDTGVHTAQENMAIDADLLESLDSHALPILHFYSWQGNCATYGHFVDPADYLDLDQSKQVGLSLARRPTGGGIVFHIWDLAFSVLVPENHIHFSRNTLDNYGFVNHCVLTAIRSFLDKKESPILLDQNSAAFDTSCMRFCMAQPTKYDVVVGGKKIAGAAQRKTKKGFLHQGTIALQLPSVAYLEQILLPDTQVLDAILAHTFPLLSPEDDLEEGREGLKLALVQSFTNENAYATKSEDSHLSH